MPAEIIIVAALYVRPGTEATFASFERQALAILREHGGRLERAVRLSPATGTPREIHVLAFPSQSAFDAYRGDPRLATLAALRESTVERTDIWSGTDVSAEYSGA